MINDALRYMGISNPSGEIEMIKNKKYQVILMDHYMPVMDGVEVVSEIRKFNSNIKFIMISQVSS